MALLQGVGGYYYCNYDAVCEKFVGNHDRVHVTQMLRLYRQKEKGNIENSKARRIVLTLNNVAEDS